MTNNIFAGRHERLNDWFLRGCYTQDCIQLPQLWRSSYKGRRLAMANIVENLEKMSFL